MNLTLWSLFFDGADRLPDAACRRIESSENYASLKQLVGNADSILWKGAGDAISDGLRKMMSLSVTDIAVAAWARHQKLRKTLDAAGPGEIVLFDLGDHRFASKHKPRMDVRLADTTLGSLQFDLVLELELKTVRLQIQERRVTRVGAGACSVKGTLKLGELELGEVSTKQVDLPGAFAIAGGVPLP